MNHYIQYQTHAFCVLHARPQHIYCLNTSAGCNRMGLTVFGHGRLALLPPPGLLPPRCPPLSSRPTRLLVLGCLAGVRHRLKGALLVFFFILRGEHRAARKSVAVHGGQAGVAAEAAPRLIARVAVAWRTVAWSAVAGRAVAWGVAKVTVSFTGRLSSCSVIGVSFFAPQAGGGSRCYCLVFSSFTFQEPIQLRKPFDGEAAGQRAMAAGAWTVLDLQRITFQIILLQY